MTIDSGGNSGSRFAAPSTMSRISAWYRHHSRRLATGIPGRRQPSRLSCSGELGDGVAIGWSNCRRLVQARDAGQPLVVTIDVRSEEDSLRLTAQKTEPLDDVVAHAAAALRVFVGEARALASLKSAIAREAGGAAASLSSSTCRAAKSRWHPRRLQGRPQDPRCAQVTAGNYRLPRHLRPHSPDHSLTPGGKLLIGRLN
jgi:hypothetical protein